MLTPKANNKLYSILRILEPGFKPYTKIRYNKKVNNRPQVNNAILWISGMHPKHLVIKNIVI
jgi:hypothetical protein